MLKHKTYSFRKHCKTVKIPIARSIQIICTRLICSEHLNLFQIFSEIISFSIIKMATSGSHKGHSDSHWASKIKDFAAGTPFGRGERPRKGTKWDLVSQKVEKCPKYRNASNVRMQYSQLCPSILCYAGNKSGRCERNPQILQQTKVISCANNRCHLHQSDNIYTYQVTNVD